MRVGIAYQSDAIAGVLAQIVRSKAPFTIAWRVADAAAAVERCATDRPDVLLLQSSPDAVAATRQIVTATPCAIILIVEHREKDAGLVFEAMSVGALDAVLAPRLAADGGLDGAPEILEKIQTASKLAASFSPPRPPARQAVHASRAIPPLVAIGASTGGPTALVRVLVSLPADYQAAIVVVQHVGAEFCEDLAQWLAGHIALPVHEAVRGARPQRGVVTLVGGNEDAVMTPGLTLAYQHGGPESFYHPSVDAFFESVAAHWPSPGIAVILSGIGRDGAEGLLALRQAGWTTIAQDESTSAVFGMPKAAAELQAATRVLPVEEIGPMISRFGAVALGAEKTIT